MKKFFNSLADEKEFKAAMSALLFIAALFLVIGWCALIIFGLPKILGWS